MHLKSDQDGRAEGGFHCIKEMKPVQCRRLMQDFLELIFETFLFFNVKHISCGSSSSFVLIFDLPAACDRAC